MTRNEEIQKLIDEENGIDNYGSLDYQIGVCDGVRLADKTMIEKACKWLIEKIDEDVLIKCGSVIKCIDAVEFSEYFRKAMEE